MLRINKRLILHIVHSTNKHHFVYSIVDNVIIVYKKDNICDFKLSYYIRKYDKNYHK